MGDPWARCDTKPVLSAQMLAVQHLLPVLILGPNPCFSTFLHLPISFPICLLKSLQIPSAQCRGRTTDNSAEPPYTSYWGHRNPLQPLTGVSLLPDHILQHSSHSPVPLLSLLGSFVFPTQQKGEQPTLLAASSRFSQFYTSQTHVQISPLLYLFIKTPIKVL